MAFTFITGGSSSGKSAFVVELFRDLHTVCFIATGSATDPEMARRIQAHRRERPRGWKTVEEPLDLRGALENCDRGGVIVDDLTFWVTNQLYQARTSEEGILRLARETASVLSGFSGRAAVVTNEIGQSLVPDKPDARKFRKLAGEVNRIFAGAAREAYLIVSGLPVRLK
jgi:adenosyl cobinamide kinase/adenosyl cobinamide phosphate guanylyltransferase